MWNSWVLWNANIWFYHHVYNHHSFTGQENKDPDLYHLRPFTRKIKTDNKIVPFFLSIQDKIIPYMLFIFPGQYFGQCSSYFLASFKYRIFKIAIPKMNYYDIMDIILILGHLYCLYYTYYLVIICYIISLNIVYSINIIPDHDTYETNVENHYTGKDWCKMQICNSGNFLNNNFLWTHMFGAINYQIEHHLFPNMSSVHYPTIAPIVKQFCKENNIPYVHHDTLWSAYNSFIKMVKYNKTD
jgi:linoleoyl-CoA desaturase